MAFTIAYDADRQDPGHQDPASGFSGTEFVAVWVAMGEAENSTSSSWLDGDLPSAGQIQDDGPGSRLDLVIGGASDQWPILSSGAPGRVLLVWEHRMGIEGEIFAQLLGGDGTPLTSSPLTRVSGSAGSYENPGAAWNGIEWLVVWDGPDGRIEGARLDADAALIGAPFVIAEAGIERDRPRVASDGQDYLVAWTTLYGDPTGVMGVRVAADGTVIGTPIEISTTPLTGCCPEVAWDGTRYMVAWRSPGVWVTPVTTDGTAGNPQVVSDSLDAMHPCIVSTDPGVLVAWREAQQHEDAPHGPWEIGIFGTVFDADGVLVDPDAFRIHLGFMSDGHPSAAGADGRFLVTWDAGIRDEAAEPSGVFGAFVTLEREPGDTGRQDDADTDRAGAMRAGMN